MAAVRWHSDFPDGEFNRYVTGILPSCLFGGSFVIVFCGLGSVVYFSLLLLLFDFGELKREFASRTLPLRMIPSGALSAARTGFSSMDLPASRELHGTTALLSVLLRHQN